MVGDGPPWCRRPRRHRYAPSTDRSPAGARRDQFFGAREIGFAGGAGEQSVVTDAMEPFWQDVDQGRPDRGRRAAIVEGRDAPAVRGSSTTGRAPAYSSFLPRACDFPTGRGALWVVGHGVGAARRLVRGPRRLSGVIIRTAFLDQPCARRIAEFSPTRHLRRSYVGHSRSGGVSSPIGRDFPPR
jgi:hypothetical protein